MNCRRGLQEKRAVNRTRLQQIQRGCMFGEGFLVIAATIALSMPASAGQYNQGDVELGFSLFNANCITCHGSNGDSVPGINLRTGQFRRVRTDDDLNRLIQTGIPGTAMPPGRYSTAELGGMAVPGMPVW